MKKGVLLLLFLGQLTILPQINSTIIFSELMFYPMETNGEFIEIYNSSLDSSINLENFHIIYSTSSADTIVELRSEIGSVLPSKSYAVIFENDYNFINGLYLDLVPDNVLMLKIDNGKFGSSGMANKSDRIIYLLNEIGDTIDTHTYSANNSAGISDEIIDVETRKSENNWENSTLLHGTPGFRNSVSLSDYDLEISTLQFFPEEIFVDDEIEFKIKIKNRGKKEATDFNTKLYIDFNHDASPQDKEIILSQNDSVLKRGDSIIHRTIKAINQSGMFTVFGEINFSKDEKEDNDSISSTILIYPKPNEYADIVINEIMFKPINDEPEWIEIFNRSDSTINLKDWLFADRTSRPKIIDSLYFIDTNEYLILTEDETINDYHEITSKIIVLNLPSLNNSGDDLKLIDMLGRVIDSVGFNSKWGGENGYSLERINSHENGNDSSNWNSSVSKHFATPGEINSVTPKLDDLAITDFEMLNEYGIIGENFHVKVHVKNVGLNLANTFRLSLYHDQNLNGIPEEEELIDEISRSNLKSGESEVMENNLLNFTEGENRFIAKIILENDGDEDNNEASISFVGVKLNEVRNDIIINEIMHSPVSQGPEWIEIFNRSLKTINLLNYQIADLVDTSKVVENEILLSPNQYFVFADDSSFIETKPDVEDFIITSFPNLNNSGDKIVLLDSLSRVIDSLQYSSTWGGSSGKSLERKLSNLPSVDSLNWNSSKDIKLSTPGRKNSITPFVNDLMIAKINPIPNSPIIDDEIKVEITIKNVGLQDAENFKILINYVINGESSTLEEISGEDLFTGDSLILESSEGILLENSVIVKAQLIYILDEDSSNNYSEIEISPGAKINSIIINEFMANPNSNEAEWFEIVNISDRSFDISTWFISDLFPVPKHRQISESPIIIEEDGFIVVTNDTSKYLKIDNEKVIEVKFGALGNSEDGILLYDFNMSLVDSLEYDKDWDIKKGRSLERLSKFIASSDNCNWLLSLSESGSSPGISNSILETEPAIENSIVINEIMYDPDVSNSEFIELYNNTKTSIDIGGWRLIDGNDNIYEISPTFLILEPDHYFLFASDSSILNNYGELFNLSAFNIPESGSFSFSNTGESLVIIDHWGNVIDSIFYYPNWHNKNIVTSKNKSLERISPLIDGNESSNWSTSVSKNGATPGNKNSIYTESNFASSGLTFEPNPFSPDDDGFEDFSIINYSLPFTTSQIRVKIFDDKGRLVRTLVNNEASSSNGALVFDGLNDFGNPLRIGMYIVFLESVDSKSGKSIALKDVIVVARKL